MKTSLENPDRPCKGFGFIVSLAMLTLAAGFAGCASTNAVNKTISIDSDPQGIRVEVNGDDLGVTPTTFTVRANHKGNFAGGWGDTPSVVFVAFPPSGTPGLYKQTKIFSPSGFMDAGDRVPARIYFDMHLETGR
jgi:hypothetical protein